MTLGLRMLPSTVLKVSALSTHLSGLTSRPAHSLCTLHPADRSTRRNTRFRAVVSLARMGSSHKVGKRFRWF